MSTAVRRAVYNKLAGDTTLTGLLAAPPTGYAKSIYHDQAPDGATYPFIVFGKNSGTPTDAFKKPGAFETDIWLVKAVDKNTSADTAEAIAARIQTLLNDATLTISGKTHLYLRRQSDVEYPELASGVLYRHAGGLYRLVYE